MKIVLTSIVGILLVYLAATAYLYLSQRSFIFFPTEVMTHGYPVERLDVGEASVEILVLNAGQRDAVLYFGGNAEAAVWSAADIDGLLPHHTVYITSYRGYGNSSGAPSEQVLFDDALALWRQVSTRHEHVVAAGRSLGSGVAVWLASQVEISRLLLITPYESIVSLAARRFPIFPVRWLMKDRFDSIRYVPAVTVPVLALIAESDSIIPRESSMRLLAGFKQDLVTSRVLNGTDHNTVSQHPDYYPEIIRFLENDLR